MTELSLPAFRPATVVVGKKNTTLMDERQLSTYLKRQFEKHPEAEALTFEVKWSRKPAEKMTFTRSAEPNILAATLYDQWADEVAQDAEFEANAKRKRLERF